MASLIDDTRRRRCEINRIRKKRADQVNHICFLMICTAILYAGIVLFLALGGLKNGLLYALFLLPSIVCGILACIKRNIILNIVALLLYLAGCIISRNFLNLFYAIPLCGALWANITEQKLSQEEGYPQFDLEAEEHRLQEKLEAQTKAAIMGEKIAADLTQRRLPDLTPQEPQSAPHSSEMDTI